MTQVPQVPEGFQFSPQEQAAILERLRSEIGLEFPFETLEELVTSADGFGLTTATPLQRAILRILEGRALGDLADNETVQRAVGTDQLPEFDGPPSEVDILAAVRTAKSLFAAGVALWASQKCDVSGLGRGEIPRYSIISLERDNAAVTFGHLIGALQQPALCNLRVPEKTASPWRELIDEAGIDVIGSVFLWHPSGRPIEIRIVAGKRAGGSLVSRWSAGFCPDEAPRMLGESEGVINYDDARRAVRTRLLPGAQIVSIGSPWRAQGPIYERFLNHFGAPTAKRVIIKATGPAMNPFWWTPERCEEIRVEDPEAFKTDVLAEFLEPLEALINPLIVNRSMREEPLHIPWEPGHEYTAAMDPATRANSWTFGIADRVGRVKRIVYHAQWQGTSLDPLSPRAILEEIAEVLAEYRLDWINTDQWSSESIRDIADELAFHVIAEDWTGGNKKTSFQNFADAMADDQIELPPDQIVAADLRMIQKRRTANDFTIMLPKTGDKRHCDYAPTFVRLLQHWINEDMELAPEKGDDGYDDYMEEQMELKELEEFEAKNDELWWDRDPWESSHDEWA